MARFCVSAGFIFLCWFCCTLAVFIPLEPLHQQPVCTSHSGLCHLAYRYVTDDSLGHVLDSPVCSCPDNQKCTVEWDDHTNAITKTFKNAGQEMEVKISYCRLSQPENICGFNRAAVVTMGNGPFLFEIDGDFQCRCARRLFAHRSWSEGDRDFIEYSCGKSRCARHSRNDANGGSRVCGRITYHGPNNDFLHEYFCRCTRYEECIPTPGGMPDAANPEMDIRCRPAMDTARFLRK